jgi:iron-sulfur cluster assembly accessory protein
MIQLNHAAANEVKRLQSKQKKPDVCFRLGVQPGGCCHWYYTMTFDDLVNDNERDRVYESESIKIVVSEEHLKYLDGLTLDYSEDLMGGSFRFNNPNATQSCSCGHSFFIAEN